MKKTSKNTNIGITFGMCFGVAIGTSYGVGFGNMAVGISLGISIGLALGLVWGSQKDKGVNNQVEEKGYTIKSIEAKDENKEYVITIVNNSGEELVVIVPAGQMETELFTIGDIVFLDEDGLIEQAFDTEDK